MKMFFVKFIAVSVVCFFSSCTQSLSLELNSEIMNEERSLGTNFDSIPLVVACFEHGNYQGAETFYIENQSDLSIRGNNDSISSVIVYRGPSYQAYKDAHNGAEPTVTFYQHGSYQGTAIKLIVGCYSFLGTSGFNDYASSIYLNAPNSEYVSIIARDNDSDSTYLSIPLIIEAYYDGNYNGLRQVYICKADMYGKFKFYNDQYSSLVVKAGPNFSSQRALLYKDGLYSGTMISLPVGDYSDLSLYGFNDCISSFGVSF